MALAGIENVVEWMRESINVADILATMKNVMSINDKNNRFLFIIPPILSILFLYLWLQERLDFK
jgi:hypothetical protein